MLKRVMAKNQEMYGVYYQVCGCLAGQDRVCREYLWAGPYSDIKSAITKVEELKFAHQNDDSFIVKRYTRESEHHNGKMN
ncbi:MAG TPA: hypothetical protein V6D28_27010 [Leptolyngbyaceae cyanobacterium]